MRKHFLILMLLALLPLAGFAQTSMDDVNFSVSSVPYGTAALNPATQFLVTYDVTLDKDTHYTWDGKYYSDEACTSEVTLATANVGTYYVKIVGMSMFVGEKVQSFEVTKRPINVTLLAGLEKVYGAADPALTAGNIDWTGAAFQNGQNQSVFSGSLTYEYDNGNVGVHALSVTGYTATNYTLNITGAGLTITAKPITAGMITPVALSELYKAEAYDEFTANIKDGSTPLVAGTDFELKAYTTDALAVEAAPTNVGTYYLGITEKAGANYSVAAATLVGTFEITQAGLTVRALPQTREYDGTTALPSVELGTAYEIIGAQGTDVFTAFTAANFDVTGDKNVGSKTVTPKNLAGANVAQYDINYVASTLTITKKTGLKLTANDFSKVYGQADAAATGYRANFGYTSADVVGKGFGGVKVEGAVGTEWQTMGNQRGTGAAANNGSLEVERSNTSVNDKGEYAGVLTIKYVDGGVWSNYDMENAEITAGKFTITGGKVYVTALNQKKNYGEDDPDWDAVLNTNYIVSGLSGNDEITGVTLTRAEGNAVDDYAISITATGIPSGYQDVVFVPGTFSIKERPITISAKVQTLKIGDTAADLDQNAFTILNTKDDEGLTDGDNASDVFSLTTLNALNAAGKFADAITYTAGTKAGNYNIVFLEGDLIVIDPEATIALNRPAKAAYTADPTLDDAATVIAAAAAAKFTKAQANAYAKANLVGGVVAGDIQTPGADAVYYTQDEADTENKDLAGAIDYTGYVAGNNFTAAQVTAYNGAINPETPVTDATEITADHIAAIKAYNATLDGAKSTEDIKTPETHVRYTDDTAYGANVLLDGAVTTDDARPACVTFGDFNMVAEKWYPIVLPFATSVREVSEAFGYAIVNILKKDNTDATKIAFKLHMGAIPANEPFVVKVYEDINMNEVTFGDPANPYATGKSIVNSDAPQVADASGVKFIGRYSAKTDGFKANEAFFSVSAEKNDYYWGSASNTTYMAPLAAYFQIPAGSAARTIIFEEADGSTTAIEAVAAFNEVKSNEGWYTIGGVKLQNAPTQKGIYIQNGKKVVVK